MGSKKRVSLKQMEKMQARRGKKEDKIRSNVSATKKSAGIFPPNPKGKKVVDELKKMRVLTPYAIASQFDLRLSVAKHFLEELERQGTIEHVSSSKNLRIYKLTD